MSNTTISDIIVSAGAKLASAGVEDPVDNCCFLIGHALEIPPHQVKADGSRTLTEAEKNNITSLINRRAKRETINRIIGKTKFCGLDFGTNEATLEPRPDSEFIVRAIVKKVKRFPWFLRRRKPLRVLDLGTGSGCLLLSFLHALPNATGIGVDFAPRTLEQAHENAKTLGLDKRCEFRLNNWASDIEEKFDIIAFNPPYIPSAEIPKLMPAVQDFDPMDALDGGEDGMDPFRIVIPQLPKLLNKGGFVGIEFWPTQTEQIAQLLRQTGYTDINLCMNAHGIDRGFIVRPK